MAYKFKEVICPLCDHKFMVNITEGSTYEIRGDKTVYHEATCPKCGELLLVSEESPEGVLLNDIPDDMLKYYPVIY